MHLEIARQAKHCLALRLRRGVVGEVVRGGAGGRGGGHSFWTIDWFNEYIVKVLKLYICLH